MTFTQPDVLLLGPGPSNSESCVLKAMAQPTIGHLDPRFGEMMEEVKDLLRYAFQTENAMTFPLSAPASLAMESALCNLLEPGDKAIICQNGVFGGRMADIVQRIGAELVLIEDEWGKAVSLQKVAEAVRDNPDAKLVGFVHAETSTGVRSDAAGICAIAKAAGMLTIMDTVTGLAGVPVRVDDWGVDVAYSGTQKCLGVPPGLAPMTFSDQALDVIRNRKTPVQSWFCDLNLVMGYWSGAGKRSYHHTAPVNAIYGLYVALKKLREETLEVSHQRHACAHKILKEKMDELDLDFLVDEMDRLPQMNAIIIPEGLDEAAIRSELLMTYGIEMGAGLGPFAGKVWRLGLMGPNAHRGTVERWAVALTQVLKNARAKQVDVAAIAAE
ncbi:MAG: alanine--glyoxylate aminotransferase family protein [Pseudomonadota bacterium]